MLPRLQHELLRLGSGVNPRMYQAGAYSSGASLVLVVWDLVLSLDREVDHIWLGPCRGHVKWIYLFSRWFGLLSQFSFHLWVHFVEVLAPTPTSICQAFYIFEAVCFQLLQLSLDAILILRICALYQQRRRYIALAFAMVLFEFLMSIITQAISIPKSTVGGRCSILHTPAMTLCLGIGLIVSQSVLLVLIYRGKALLQPVARRSRLIVVVVRDGFLVFTAIIGVALLCIFYLLLDQVFINVFWPWMLAMPAILTPRIILNMQTMTKPTETVLELTTNLGAVQNSETEPPSTREVTIICEQYMDSA